MAWQVCWASETSRVCGRTCCHVDPLPESATKFIKTDGSDDELKRVRKGNLILLGMFEAALTDKVSYSQIKASITAEHLEGVASEVLKSLDKIHLKMRPSDKAEKLKMFRGMKLKRNENPEEFFTELDEMKADLLTIFTYKVEDDELIDIIIGGLNELYMETKVLLRMGQNSANIISISEIKDTIRLHYDTLLEFKKVTVKHKSGKTKERSNEDDSDEDRETALPVYPHKTTYKGMCRTCGLRGHKAADCFENDKNKDKRPVGWKTRKDKKGPGTAGGNGGKDKSQIECFFCKKKGHYKNECKKFLAQQAAGNNDERATLAAEENETAELVLVTIENEESNNHEDYVELSDGDDDSMFGYEYKTDEEEAEKSNDSEYSFVKETDSSENMSFDHVLNVNDIDIDTIETYCCSWHEDDDNKVPDDFFDHFETGDAKASLGIEYSTCDVLSGSDQSRVFPRL